MSAAARRGHLAPYTGSVFDVMDAASMVGPSWVAWRVFLKAIYGLPLSPEELAVYRRHTDRQQPPSGPVSEAWMIVGRRGGKSSVAALCAVHGAITRTARPGDSVTIPLVASDRRQARVLLRYVRGLCHLPAVAPYVFRSLRETTEFKTGVNAEIITASVAAPRGYEVPAACADEAGHWTGTTPDAANPDAEILSAIRGGMATVPGALLLVLSSPYAQEGEVWRVYEQSFGRDDPDVLVWCADSLSMHPPGDDAAGRKLVAHIEREWRRDPVNAASEYGRDGRVVFRTQTAAAFVSTAQVDAVIDRDVREREADLIHRYICFVDVSGGRVDAWTLAIAHKDPETGAAVLDVLRQRLPPLDIGGTIEEWMDVLVEYDVRAVIGDRYAGEFNRQAWQAAGVRYDITGLTKDELYLEFLSALNTGKVLLLDDPTLRAQLLGLQRKPRSGGTDRIDHPHGGRDDVVNAAVGALLQVLGVGEPKREQGKTFPVVWA